MISQSLEDRTNELFVDINLVNNQHVDRLFLVLMLLQWVIGVAVAVFYSPYTWIGEQSLVHFHVWAAIVVGGAISAAPIFMVSLHSGTAWTRHVIAISQALWGTLLIHLTGGRLETHFHVFGSLAIIAFYRDWRVILTMTVVVAVDHAVRGIYWPLSVYGIPMESPFRWLEHAAWVIFEDIFLILACLRSQREVHESCQNRARLERTNFEIEEKVQERSRELLASKEFFQAVMDSIVAHVCVLDRSGNIINTNKRWNEFGGMGFSTAGNGIGANYIEVCRKSTGDCAGGANEIADAIEEISAGRSSHYMTEYPCHSLTKKQWFQVNITPFSNRDLGAVVVVHTDITDRVLAQNELFETNKHLELLSFVAKYTDNAVIITDSKSKIDWVNDGFTRITGYSLSEAAGVSPGSLLQGELTNKETVRFMRERLAKKEGFDVEVINYRKSGEPYWSNIEARPIRDESGTVERFIAIESDISARKSAELSLRLLRSAIDQARDALFIFNPDSTIHDLNCAACDLAGYDRDELVGQPILKLKPQEENNNYDWRQVWEKVKINGGMLYEGTYRNKNSDLIPVEISKVFVEHKSSEYVCAVVRDIRERKKEEEERELIQKELQVAARHAGMAEVATGVLHNVGNVLNSINVSSNLLNEKLHATPVELLSKVSELIQDNANNLGEFFETDERGRKFPEFLHKLSDTFQSNLKSQLNELENLIGNVGHIKEIVSTQQSFAKTSGVTESVNPHELFDDALKITENSHCRSTSEIVRNYDHSSPQVIAFRHEVLQILINLIRNAQQASESSQLANRNIELKITEVEGFVDFVVRDHGIGISKENLTRIFQHGFTTKEDGHGFGLHSAANAAQRMGGGLIAESAGVGKGATFTLRIPQDVHAQPLELATVGN